MERFTWVLFDADHTLFDFDRASEEAMGEMLAAHGADWAPGMYADYKRINVQAWREHEEGLISRDTLVYERFRRYYAFRGLDLDPIATQQEYLHRLSRKTYLMDGATELLDSLRGKIRIGYITNGMKEVQRPRLEAIGWVDRFDAIVIGGEVGLSKPEPAYFAYTHAMIGQPPHASVLVVGDSLSADIAGALRFGYTACWYNPDGHAQPDKERPHHTVSHLKNVMDILR